MTSAATAPMPVVPLRQKPSSSKSNSLAKPKNYDTATLEVQSIYKKDSSDFKNADDPPENSPSHLSDSPVSASLSVSPSSQESISTGSQMGESSATSANLHDSLESKKHEDYDTAKNELKDSTVAGKLSKSLNFEPTNKDLQETLKRREINNDVTKIEDPEINYFLKELDLLAAHLEENEANVETRTNLIDIVNKTKSKLLRLNLNKNLSKFQLKHKEEDHQTELQLLLKNISTFERHIQILKNENEMINIKNLKLIKYCKSLKNDKIKTLKKENSQLKRQLEKYTTILSPITDTHPSQFGTQNSSGNAEGGEFKRKRRSDSSNSSGSSSSNSPNSAVVGGNNMLDTLGRLASHVLEDGEFKSA